MYSFSREGPVFCYRKSVVVSESYYRSSLRGGGGLMLTESAGPRAGDRGDGVAGWCWEAFRAKMSLSWGKGE